MDESDREILASRLYEDSNDAVFVLDCETNTVRQANPTAQRLTSLKSKQLRGQQLEQLIHSNCAEKMPSMLLAIRETGFFHSQEDFFLVRDQLEPLPINITVSRIHLPSGEIGLVVVRDISDRKRAEIALREFNDELDRRVKTQTAELETANQRLRYEVEERRNAERMLHEAIGQLEQAQQRAVQRERLQALGQIAGGVAHDINNSLLPLTSFSELILGVDLDSQTRQWAEGVHTAAVDIAGTVRRLRQFYEDRASPDSMEQVDLVELVHEVVHLTSPKWRDEALRSGKEILVTVDAEASPVVNGDVSALRSVLTNLLFNAIDACEKSLCIKVRIGQQCETAAVEIVDDGNGMTEEVRMRCREPFFSTKADGTGLGLSVCHGIIASHGGRIEIDSAPNEGTTIQLLIPTSKEASPKSKQSDRERTEPTANPLVSKRILYVDDNQAARDSSAALLTSLGIIACTAEDAAKGLLMLDEDHYDAVITDLSMPGMDGREFIRAIKSRQPTMAVVMISGWLSIKPEHGNGDAQPDGVLAKPFSVDQLKATLIPLLSTCADQPAETQG